MEYNKNYSVLVNSCDSFEDCWDPYFILFKKFWPKCDAKIYLNTEKKDWKINGLTINCTQVQNQYEERLNWSECLLKALDKIQTPLVLYFQEDYFIHQEVRHELIRKCSEYMIDNPDVSHIALTKHCSHGPFLEHSEEWLQVIRQNARYRICTQAGLWRVDALRSYLDPVENGWMFEIFGTWRAQKRNDIFLSAKWDDSKGGPAIDYLHTGIIKGKWLQEIEEIFNKNNIIVDFSQRGVYKPKPKIIQKYEVALKLLENKRYLFRQIRKLCLENH